MENRNHSPSEKAARDLWRLLFSVIYFLIFLVVSVLGYVLLEDSIHAYFNKKKYTKEELELLDRKAAAHLSAENEERNWDRISNGIHLRTGLHDDPSLQLVIASCTSCHSAKLITQNKATRAGWQSMITWMQKTQGLPDLGTSEPVILDYLAKYYAPTEVGRRKNLDVEEIKWFVLNLNK